MSMDSRTAPSGASMLRNCASENDGSSASGPDRKGVGFSLVERLEFRVARSSFSGGSTMTRHFFLAIALLGTGALLNSSAAATTAYRCEDRAANCVGRCSNFTGGAGDFRGHQNKCMLPCDRQV